MTERIDPLPEWTEASEEDAEQPRPDKRRRRLFAVLVLALAFAFLGAQLPLASLLPTRALNPRDLTHFIDHIALMREKNDGSRQHGWVRKWSGDVQVRLQGPVDGAERARMMQVLETVSGWSGVHFTVARAGQISPGYLTIWYRSKAEMVQQYGTGGAVCMTTTYGNSGRLHSAFMEVSLPFSDCLTHEFMHVLGIDNHWSGPGTMADVPTVLAPRGSPRRTMSFSDWDEAAIRLLYDPRIRPGMRRQRALETLTYLLASGMVVLTPSGRT